MRSRKVALNISFLALILPTPLLAADYNPALELGPICAAELNNPSPQNSQRSLLCKSAAQAEDTSFTNDNNARVLIPVAVVCYYTCALSNSGTPTMQKVCGAGAGGKAGGGGGSPCTIAQTTAKSAASADQQAFDDRVAKYGNLVTAAAMESTGSATVSGGGASAELNSAIAKSAGGAMPESCRKARSSGNLDDRLDCALATNPNVPRFVKDPKFQAEFQQITGYSLQSMINKSESDVNSNYGPQILKNIYGNLRGKASFGSIVATAEKAISGAMESVDTSAGNANLFAGNIHQELPTGTAAMDSLNLSGNLSGNLPGGGLPGEGEAAAHPGNPLAELNAMPPREDLNRGLASNAGNAEDSSDLSLFARASHRYRLVMDRVEKLDWDLPENKN